jgi:pantothenate kinase type III
LEEVVRRYAEKIGKWPQTVLTGSSAKIIKDDCQFIDSYVPSLVVKGIALAYRKYLDSKQ